MYCLQLGSLKWYYATALEAWNDRHLEARKNFRKMDFGADTITGIKTYDEFVQHLDDGAVLQYHALKVYKVDD